MSTEKKIDKDIELLKIQLYSRIIYARHYTFISIVFSMFITFSVLAVGFLYNGLISSSNFLLIIFGNVLVVIFGNTFLIWLLQEKMREIQNMINKVIKVNLYQTWAK